MPGEEGIAWLLFTFRLPAQPSSARVYIWRKLRQLGSIQGPGGVHVLPESARNCEHFMWLATEIEEMGGTAGVWTSKALLPGQGAGLEESFFKTIERAYQTIEEQLNELESNFLAGQGKDVGAELKAIAKELRRLQQTAFGVRSLEPKVRKRFARLREVYLERESRKEELQ